MAKHRSAPGKISRRHDTWGPKGTFTWPRERMRDLYRYYDRTGQTEMAELMAHEIQRHERIERKLQHERETENGG